MLPEIIVLILEIIGTVAFAVSGAFVAMKRGLDIFGVIFVGCITAFGGGIIRDIIVGAIPPAAFLNFHIFVIAVLTSVAVFIIAHINKEKFDFFRQQIININNFFDAVGLAAFSVMGTEVCFVRGFSDNAYLAIVLGMLTGVGGGIFRDILTDTTPYVFKKHVYALASILGSGLYYVLRRYTSDMLMASVLSMILVVVMRMLAAKYRWSLPKIKLSDEADLTE